MADRFAQDILSVRVLQLLAYRNSMRGRNYNATSSHTVFEASFGTATEYCLTPCTRLAVFFVAGELEYWKYYRSQPLRISFSSFLWLLSAGIEGFDGPEWRRVVESL